MKKFLALSVLALAVSAQAQVATENMTVYPNLPEKGYVYKDPNADMFIVFETETPCEHPVIKALPEAAKKGLFQVRMYSYDLKTLRVEGCSGIEDRIVTIKWFDGNAGGMDLDELFPIRFDTYPPEVTPRPTKAGSAT